MDPRSEHGDGSPPSSLSSAPVDGERAETQQRAEPVAAAAPTEGAPSPPWPDGQRVGDDATPSPDATPSIEPDSADTLSPAVRRLVRQYDLDITGVYGSGPAGKIRVGDIIGMLDGRAEPRPRASEGPTRATIATGDAGAPYAAPGTRSEPRAAPIGATQNSAEPAAENEPAQAAPTTTVFECDVSRVLSHRKRERRGDVELLVASYFIAACLEALSAVPEIAAANADTAPRTHDEVAPRLGVLLATTDGSVRRALVDTAATESSERLHAVDARLRASSDDDLLPAHILVHCYGASGSLLATPTAIGNGHVGSIGIGRVRREIVVKTIDGQEVPRVAALCYLTFSFRPECLALERANRFVGEWVRVLEQWPVEPPAGG